MLFTCSHQHGKYDDAQNTNAHASHIYTPHFLSSCTARPTEVNIKRNHPPSLLFLPILHPPSYARVSRSYAHRTVHDIFWSACVSSGAGVGSSSEIPGTEVGTLPRTSVNTLLHTGHRRSHIFHPNDKRGVFFLLRFCRGMKSRKRRFWSFFYKINPAC